VGYYAAWMDNRTGNPDIYIYSLAQEIELPIAASPYEDMYPDINGNIVSWIARNPLNQYQIENYWSIRTFDMAIDNSTELVYGLEDAAPISLSDNYLAYLRKPVAKFRLDGLCKASLRKREDTGVSAQRHSPACRQGYRGLPG